MDLPKTIQTMTPESRSMLLAKAIEAKMKERGLSRVEFAEAMKSQPSTVTKWLKGGHNFTIETLFEIEKVLQFDIFNLTSNDHPSAWAWFIKRNRTKQSKNK